MNTSGIGEKTIGPSMGFIASALAGCTVITVVVTTGTLVVLLFSIFSMVASWFTIRYLKRVTSKLRQQNIELDKLKTLSIIHSQFVTSIGSGAANTENLFPKEDQLGNRLFEMSQKIRASQFEEQMRNWQMSGLNELSALLRNATGMEANYRDVLSFIVKYLNANQGGIFIISQDGDERYLELKASYAYEKHKMTNVKLNVDHGLIGQCIAERDMIYLEKVPENYVHITSGLGHATPTSVVIIPLRMNDEIVGVLELASFQKLKKTELDFLLKAAEAIGGAIASFQRAAYMTKMLNESRQMAEELRSQQEEVRQNMEELEATQEQLTREAREREKLQLELAKSKEFLNLVIDSVPIPVFAKDRNHRMVLVNKAVCELNNMTKDQMLGKSDYDFFSPAEADVFWRFEEDIFIRKTTAEKVEHAIRNGRETYTLDKKLAVSTDDGEEFLIGINIDITHAKMIEKQNVQQPLAG